MTTDQKGAIAETAIAHEATKLGIEVYKPVAEGGRYDCILAVGDKLLRAQVKWAARHEDVVIVRCYSCRRTATGLLKRTYNAAEIDGIAAYCADVDRSFFIPIGRIDGRSHFQLRLAPARNNQQLGINWADDFDFGRYTDRR